MREQFENKEFFPAIFKTVRCSVSQNYQALKNSQHNVFDENKCEGDFFWRSILDDWAFQTEQIYHPVCGLDKTDGYRVTKLFLCYMFRFKI